MWSAPESFPTVAELVAHLDRRVAGLADQKARLALALVRHARAAADGSTDVPANLLIIGPTGGGKSFMVHQACEASGLPYLEVNATMFSPTSYAGLDLRSLFLGFLESPWVNHGERQQAMLPLAERFGVVVIDEIDKWRMEPIQSHSKDDRQLGKQLQFELLKLLEGDTTLMTRQDSQRGIPFNTHHILFIGVGAFEGLNAQMQKKYHTDNPIEYTKALHPDLNEYGFVMELCGRFPNVVALPPLDAQAMANILVQHFIPRYQAEASRLGVTLEVPFTGIWQIAQLAITRGTGARAFMNLMESLLWKPLSNCLPGQRIVLDAQAVLANEGRLHIESPHFDEHHVA